MGRCTRFRIEWGSLSPWSRALAWFVLCEGIFVIVYEIASMTLLYYAHMAHSDSQSDVTYYTFEVELAFALVVILNSIFFIYFAFDAVLNENRFEMTAFGITSLVLTARIIWFFISERWLWTSSAPGRVVEWLALVALIVICLAQVVLFILFVQAWKNFGWKLWKEVRNADKKLLYAFGNYQAFMSALKIDLQFGCSLLILAAFFLYDASHSYALYVIIAGTVLSFAWAALGWFVIRREKRLGCIPFMLFFVIEPTYIIYKIINLYKPQEVDPCSSIPCSVLVVYGAGALVVRLLLLFFTIRSIRRFGRGLKRVFGLEENVHQERAVGMVPLNQRLLSHQQVTV